MLTITQRQNSASAKAYYQKEDVAVRDTERLAPEFGGQAIDAGEFDTKRFNRLVDGKHPETNAQLTPRQRSDRIVLWDATFDPPKSVTLAIWYNPEGEKLREAFHAAVRDTMREYVEPLAATRVRKNGVYEDRQTQSMTWAFFPHSLARPVRGVPSPNEHVHVTVFNHTWDAAEQRFKALKVHEIKKQAPVIQDEFHRKLRENVEALGFRTRDKGQSFELAGVSNATIRKFSQRRGVITEFIDRHVIPMGKRRGGVGLATREEKAENHTLASLKAEWDSRLTQKERHALETLKSPKLGTLSKLVRKNKAHVALLQRLSTLVGHEHGRGETRRDVWGRG